MTNIAPTIKNIKELLKRVKDPELGIDIISLGFIKKIEITKDKIKISMVLTFAGCPFIPMITSNIAKVIESKYKTYLVEIKILKQKWIPPES